VSKETTLENEARLPFDRRDSILEEVLHITVRDEDLSTDCITSSVAF
jgi:hypothetical protein